MLNDEEKEKILIVDDSEINRAILADMLMNRYEVLEAENGIQAVKLLHKYGTSIALVLLDVAVSYTHLDVYKRQQKHSVNIFLRVPNFIENLLERAE